MQTKLPDGEVSVVAWREVVLVGRNPTISEIVNPEAKL